MQVQQGSPGDVINLAPRYPDILQLPVAQVLESVSQLLAQPPQEKPMPMLLEQAKHALQQCGAPSRTDRRINRAHGRSPVLICPEDSANARRRTLHSRLIFSSPAAHSLLLLPVLHFRAA